MLLYGCDIMILFLSNLVNYEVIFDIILFLFYSLKYYINIILIYKILF